MAIDKEKKSNRLLASRRYTHDSFTDAQESFTNVLDLQASEVYTQAHKIPSTNLPFSGSSQQGQIYTDSGDNILKYYYRHKLTKSNLNNEVWFFLNPSGSDSGIGAQLIDSNQQTSFISPKYSDSSLANATAEDNTPGYLAKVFISTAATSASVSDSDVISVNNYTFDYKTGVVQFTDGTVDPSNSQYVYMSVNQYVGKTLADGIEITGDISGSASSTGSFGNLVIAGNISASGVVRADAFESVTGGDTIDFKDSVSVTGDVNADNLTADSSSFSTRVTNLKTNSGSFSTRVTDLKTDSGSFSTRVTNLKIDSGSFSTRITADSSSFSTRTTDLENASASFSTRVTTAEGELENTIISASKQLEEQISGSFTAPSASFSNRLTTEETNVDALQADSGSFSTRVTNLKTNSGSFSTRITNLVADSASFSTRITVTEGELENTLISASKQLEQQISGSFTAPSASFSTRITNLKIDSGSISTRLSDVEAGSTSKTLVSSSAQIADEISGSFTQDSASISIRLSDVEAGSTSKTLVSSSAQIADEISGSFTSTSASISERLSSVEAGSTSKTLVSSSAQIADEISGSFVAPSSSFSSRITTLEGSGEIQSLGTTDNVLFNTITSSNDVKFERNLVVAGTITAQEIHTEIESASIIFTSGSTKFGNTPDDKHEFTGSLSIAGTVTASRFKGDGSELLNVFSGTVPSASISTRLTTEEINVDALQSDSGSFSTRTTILEQASASISTRLTTEEINVDALQSDSGSFSTRTTILEQASASFSTRVTTAEQELENTIISASAQLSNQISGSFTAPSASFSTRLTTEETNVDALQVDSASFSNRITTEKINVDKLQTTSSALINNFDQVQSLGKIDSVVFSNITASNNTQLAGNVLMQSELNILGNITASNNISASGNLFISGVSNFQGNITLQNDLIINDFNNLKVSSGRTLAHQLSMDVTDAWELDDDGNYMPAQEESFVIDPRFKVDAQGNIHLRKQGNELWTDDVHTYFE